MLGKVQRWCPGACVFSLVNLTLRSLTLYLHALMPAQLVTKLRMLDKGMAVVSWRLRGSIALVPVDVSLETEFALDLITGRVRPWLCVTSGFKGSHKSALLERRRQHIFPHAEEAARPILVRLKAHAWPGHLRAWR